MSVKEPIIFLAGVGIGSVGTFFLVEKKLKKQYEDLYNEEIESVKSEYKKATESIISESEDVVSFEEVSPKMAAPVDYSSIAPAVESIPEEEVDPEQVAEDEAEHEAEENVTVLNDKAKPYRITETDFYSYDGYDQETLVLYSDGHLAEESTDNIVNIKDTVGNLLNELRQNNTEPIFVRNEWLGFDYMICYDDRTYYQVTGIYPSQE